MDRRRIQTAVLGSPDSDDPVVCPEDPQELEVFRREHANETWWCGRNLPGGCGRQLTTKLYQDRICHFAHHGEGSDGHRCGSQGRGKDSANHLFVKADLAAWLRGQGLSAEFEYPEPLGSAVVARLEDGRAILVHLARERPVRWDDEGVWEFVLGPGVQVPGDVLARRGYVCRIRFDKETAGRRPVLAGIALPGSGTQWFGLGQLALTAEGLSAAHLPAAPAVPLLSLPRGPAEAPSQRAIVTIAPSTARAVPATRNLDPVRMAVYRLDGAIHEGNAKQIAEAMLILQLHLDAGGQQADRSVRTAFAKGQRWQDQRAARRTTVVAQLQEAFTTGQLLGDLVWEAERLVRDPQTPEQERTTVAEISRQAGRRVQREQTELKVARAREAAVQLRKAAERVAAEQKELAAALERAREQKRERLQQAADQTRTQELANVIQTVRGALRKAAREGRKTSWEELARRTGWVQIGRLDRHDKVLVLVAVEDSTPDNEPLLSVLLALEGDAAALQCHRDVAHRLGRVVPTDNDRLLVLLDIERRTLLGQHR